MSLGTAFVYSGPGAGSRSVLSAVESLRQALRPSLLVDTLTAADILQGALQHKSTSTHTAAPRLLVMPGGADLPYCRHLNGPANDLIRQFVIEGGTYLGLCAGAYYGCSRVEFEVGTVLEVVGERELSFFPGTATGSVFKSFDYQSERGAVAATLRFKNLATTRGAGGGGGGGGEAEQCEWIETKDYVNGGPGFRITTLENKGIENSNSLVGNEFPCDSRLPPNIEIIATYPDLNNAAAALVCHNVGRGRAVLCSSHPELASKWLALPTGAGRSDEVVSTIDAAAVGNASVDSSITNEDEDHAVGLCRQLEENAAGRWLFWRTLLIAAGLEDALID